VLQIDLATLSANELRRLMEVAKSRGQHALAAKLSAELVARRRVRPPGPPPAPGRMNFDREAWADAPRMAAAPPRRRGPPFAALAATGLVALAVGWGTSVRFAAPVEPTLRVAMAPPARVMLAKTEPIAVASAVDLEAGPPTAMSAPAPRPPGHGRRNPCLDLPTPGERLVCGYPSLALQDRAVTAAYDRAMASAADPQALERDQAAWREASNQVWDRTRLADLYAERIRKLAAEPAS
jgi:hypothetical protein